MIRSALWSGLWLLGTVAFCGLALRPWAGDALLVTRYTAYVMPWLAVGLVPAAVAAAWARRPWLAGLLAAGAALVVFHHAPLLRFRPPLAAPHSALPLKVLSFNTWSRNRDDARIVEVVSAADPDILLLQEIPQDVFARVLARLREADPAFHATYDRALEQAVVSRYEVEPRASLRRKGQAQKVVVHSPAGAIVVYNVHPARTGGWQRRYGEIAALLEEDILLESGPVLVGGDFNSTPHSDVYMLLSRHLRSAHDEAGSGLAFTFPAHVRGFGSTWPAKPLVRIDHIFFSGHFLATNAGTLDDAGGSDHRPVFAVLAQRLSDQARSDAGTGKIGATSGDSGEQRRTPAAAPAAGERRTTTPTSSPRDLPPS